MFGYITADARLLTEEQQTRYAACYCGLCRRLGRECSAVSRLTLTYDMTFLVLLLSSLYEPEETAGRNRCAVHPVKARPHWHNDATNYGAAMNTALAAYNCLDDWQDDRNLPKLALWKLLRRPVRAIQERYPRQSGAITASLDQLSAIEAAGIPDPDGAANAFAYLLGEVFVWREDRWADDLRTVGQGLGRWVYLLDAALDLPEDRKKGRYNPLSHWADEGRTLEDFRPMLTMLLGEATAAFERLPLVQDVELLRNILYSGVWQRYETALRKQNSQNEGGSHDIRPV